MARIDYRVYLVTDDPSRYAGDWLAAVEAAVAGGVTCVQYRDTENGGFEQYARARRLKAMLDLTHTPLVVNNDVGLALAVGAAGVHVGQGDLPPSAVRRAAADRLEIGYSITSLKQFLARAEEVRAADCLGIGPVYDATATKADAAPALGLDELAAIVRACGEKPSVAIGGITLARAPAVASTGVGGLAVVSAFSKAADPAGVARRFRALF